MDIRVLKYFVSVAQEQNMTKAANLLHISQPALSRQIADLETELGTKLLTRSHRKIQITPEGYYLLERAQEIIGLVDKTTHTLQKQDTISGTLDIGAGESDQLGPVMQAVKNTIHKYPEIHVNFHSGDSSLTFSELDSGVLEFSVIMGDFNLSNYNQLELPTKNHWGVLMRKDEPLAQKDSISPSDLLGRPILSSRQATKQFFDDWSDGLSAQFDFIGTYNLFYNASLLVKTGACIALTVGGLADVSSESELTFKPLTPDLTGTNTLIWSKGRNLPKANQIFLDELQKILKYEKTKK